MSKTPAERKKTILAGAAAVVSLGLLGYMLFSSVVGGSETAESISRRRTLMDSETKEVFLAYPIPEGASFPLMNPKTRTNTLYIAETCYWTKEGGAKNEPTWVILNGVMGKTGPTICSDCGRTVVAHNPKPPDMMK